MRHKHLGRRSVSEAFAWLIVDIANKVEKVALRHTCQICGAWQEASNALVGVLDCPFLPRRTWVAKPAAGTNPFLQSPESGKLGAAIECETLTREGRQGRKCPYDLVHDWPRVPARIFDKNGIAAPALHEGRDIGVAEWTLKDEEVALPMPKLRSISNEIRTLGYTVRGWKCTVAWLSGAQRTTSATRFRQIAIET